MGQRPRKAGSNIVACWPPIDHGCWSIPERIQVEHLRLCEKCPRLEFDGGQTDWPAPGSEDTELGVLMEPEVGHGETEVHTGVQA